MGRRSTYDHKIATQVVSYLKDGVPLTQICERPEMPTDETIRNWAKADESFALDIAHAREVGYDKIAARTRLTAQGVEGHSSGDVQRDKLIVDTDLKLLAKWDPKRYGDRTTHEIEGRLETPGSLADHEAAAKLAAILEAVKKRTEG